MTTSEEIAEVRRLKEQAVEAEDWLLLKELRRQEAELLAKQTTEFKPNKRGA